MSVFIIVLKLISNLTVSLTASILYKSRIDNFENSIPVTIPPIIAIRATVTVSIPISFAIWRFSMPRIL